MSGFDFQLRTEMRVSAIHKCFPDQNAGSFITLGSKDHLQFEVRFDLSIGFKTEYGATDCTTYALSKL